jgi:L-amino acid N-acyltransferase
MRIRAAEPADAPAIAAIYNEAILTTTATFDTEPKSEEDQRQWFEEHGPRHPVLVAEEDGQVIGWASISRYSDRCAYGDTGETSTYVTESSRGRGVGRALKLALIEEARRLGYYTLIARVADGSEASLHLNESLGFRRVGTLREVGLKFGRRIDVHFLQLMLE